MATKVTYRLEAQSNQGSVKKNDDAITEDTYTTISEDFLDNVFGPASKLSRKEYMDAVANKQNWIFNSTQVRQRVEKEAGI